MPNLLVSTGRILIKTQADIIYLLRELFTVTAAAPLASPRTCEPGPGTLTIVDTGNRLSISSGALVFSSGSAFPDPSLVSVANFTRKAGRALLYDLNITTSATDSFRVGWATTTNPGTENTHGWHYYTTVLLARLNGGATTPTLTSISLSTNYNYAIILCSTGALYLWKPLTTGLWSLLWLDNAGTGGPFYVHVGDRATGATLDNIRVLDLPYPFNVDYGIATARIASPIANDTITSAPDCLIEFTMTAATGVTQTLYFRQSDANNYYSVVMSQGGSTIVLNKVVGSTPTQLDSQAQTWTNGTQYRLVIIANGNSIKINVGVTQKTAVTDSFNAAATGVKVDTAGANLIAWPGFVNLPPGVA